MCKTINNPYRKNSFSLYKVTPSGPIVLTTRKRFTHVYNFTKKYRNRYNKEAKLEIWYNNQFLIPPLWYAEMLVAEESGLGAFDTMKVTFCYEGEKNDENRSGKENER